MHNTPSDNAHNLYDLISDAHGAPDDDYNHHQWIRPLELPAGTEAAATFDRSIVEKSFLEHTKGKRKATDVESLKRHWEIILLNLVYVMYQRNWLLVPGDSKFYSQDNYWTRRLGLSYRPMKTIIDYLRDNNFVEYREGKAYKGNPVTARISPLPTLTWLLWEYFLKIEQPIEPPYLIVNTPDDGWESIQHLPNDHYEIQELAQINEFLKDQKWACKAPVQLKYKNSAFQGGRLYTPFQSLPDRRIRLRINTLINDAPIGEVDFSANHLRLNLAQNGGGFAGDTPYEDIAESAGLKEADSQAREKVKKFITFAMGSSDEKATRGLCHFNGIDNTQFEALLTSTQKLYPKLTLFAGWGIYAQNYEGQILKEVMLEGVKNNIVCLPVHDAVAVQQEHLQWAEEAMLECWDRQMETTGAARVKIDKP
ncbi:hypothetical protein N9C62_00445 [Luminiphilus sp.]|nr:hypothetical protein [Luminiphilus sp.]